MDTGSAIAKILQIDEWLGYSLEHSTAQMDLFYAVFGKEVTEDRTERTDGCIHHPTKFCPGGNHIFRAGQVSECI